MLNHSFSSSVRVIRIYGTSFFPLSGHPVPQKCRSYARWGWDIEVMRKVQVLSAWRVAITCSLVKKKKQKCHMHIDVGEKYHPAKLKDDVESCPYRAIQSSHHPDLHHSTIASHLPSSKSPKSLGLDTKTRPPAHPRHLSAKMNASKSATISAQRCNDLSAATGARPKAASRRNSASYTRKLWPV